MRHLQAVIFDWAGTLVDFGSFAPTSIFVEAFKLGFDFDLTLEEARVPMGLGKWDHIKAVGQIPEVAQRWQRQFGGPMSNDQVDEIYRQFMPLQMAKVADFSDPIPGAVDVLQHLREQGIKIGSCSGYPRQVMDKLVPVAAEKGIAPDCIIATDDLPQGGRPAPYMVLKNMLELGATDVKACVKVDDSVPGISEGLNAGMWTVALLMSGNEAGLTHKQFEMASDSELAMARVKAQKAFMHSGAHYQIDTIAELPEVLAHIEQQLETGKKP